MLLVPAHMAEIPSLKVDLGLYHLNLLPCIMDMDVQSDFWHCFELTECVSFSLALEPEAGW